MRLGFLYAGQGSQHPGMGADLYEAFPSFRETLDGVAAGFDLKEVCFTDSQGLLNRTEYTQPCMVAFAAGLTAVLRKRGIRPDVTAGLSLGEYSALHAAGVFDAGIAVRMAAFRGQAMERAAQGIASAMIAVLGMDRAPLETVCHDVGGMVVIANYNCPGQLVIGGEKAAVNRAAMLAKERGAKRCLPLKVSGPFHTPLMAPVGKELEGYFQTVSFAEPEVPVLFNCIGAVRPEGMSIQELLVRQVQSSVYMEDCIRTMAGMDINAIVEIGPGKVLSGFVHKTVPELPVYAVETATDVEQLPAWLTKLKTEGTV